MGYEKPDMEILLDIQNQVGTVVASNAAIQATTKAIQDDIIELKQKDISQSQDLEKAYEKAKARQDSIRDDLQHQINNNNQLIVEIKDAINTLSNTISSVVDQSKKQVEIALEDFMVKIEARIKTNEDEIKTLKDEKKNKIYTRWEKITEKIFYIIIAIIFAAVFKYFNFTPPKPL